MFWTRQQRMKNLPSRAKSFQHKFSLPSVQVVTQIPTHTCTEPKYACRHDLTKLLCLHKRCIYVFRENYIYILKIRVFINFQNQQNYFITVRGISGYFKIFFVFKYILITREDFKKFACPRQMILKIKYPHSNSINLSLKISGNKN